MSSGKIWWTRFVIVFACALLIFFHLIPTGDYDSSWPRPDVILCLCFLTIAKRPEYMPFWLVGFIMFFADILLGRPFGLWTAIILLASEVFRSRMHTATESSFLKEWLTFLVILFFIVLSYRLILMMSFVQTSELGYFLLNMLATFALYPILSVLFESQHAVRRYFFERDMLL